MDQSPKSILKALQMATYQPVYFIQGEENYYIDTIVHYITTQILTPNQRPFNLTILYGKEASMPHVLTQARRFPIDSCKQIVIVKEAQEMSDLKSAMGQKLLLHYIDHPQLATILVFVYKNKTLDGRSLFAKTLAQKKLLVTAKKLSDKQLPIFIQEFVTNLRLNITQNAIELIQEYMGQDLNRIVSELQKLRLTLPSHSTITASLIEQYITFEKPFNLFELQKLVIKKNYIKSYQLIQHFCLKTKEHMALPVVFMLHNFFSKVLLIHQIKAPTPSKVAQQLELTPYIVAGYLEAANHYTLPKTMQNLTYLYEADLQLKGIACHSTDHQILKELIFKLMHDL